MNIDIRHSLLAAKNTMPIFHSPGHRTQSSPPAANNPASTVTISDAGRRAASLDKVGGDGEISATSKLRDLIKQYDFHSISPRQMATLAGELRKAGEISDEAACSFIGVELNTVVEMKQDEPIDMIAHFKWMLDTIETAASSDSTLNYAVDYRKQASKTLADVLSFINDDRQHIQN